MASTHLLPHPKRLQLAHHLRRHFVAVGALLTIVAIAVDPFAQQVIQYRNEPRLLDGSNATIPIARQYLGDSSQGTSLIDAPLLSALFDGLMDSKSADTEQRASCPTGQCTFNGTFGTLGFCSSCTNVVSHLGVTFKNHTVNLGPRGRGNSSINQWTALGLEAILPDGLKLVIGPPDPSNQMTAFSMNSTGLGIPVMQQVMGDDPWSFGNNSYAVTWPYSGWPNGPGELVVNAASPPFVLITTAAITRNKSCSEFNDLHMYKLAIIRSDGLHQTA